MREILEGHMIAECREGGKVLILKMAGEGMQGDQIEFQIKSTSHTLQHKDTRHLDNRKLRLTIQTL